MTLEEIQQRCDCHACTQARYAGSIREAAEKKEPPKNWWTVKRLLADPARTNGEIAAIEESIQALSNVLGPVVAVAVERK